MSPRRPALAVRPDLLETEPYVSPQRPARYRLNTNEAPFPPPKVLVEEVAAEIAAMSLNRYPDRDARKLYDGISSHVGWPAEGLWVANGSNEVFMHLFLAFGGPGRSSMTFEPTYSMHTLIPRISGTRALQQGRGQDFEIEVDDAVAAIKRERPDVVIVCSPNNPTGDCEPGSTIEALLDVAPGIVIVDEAYGEFDLHDHSAFSLLADDPRLVITRTFSKAWRLAGVRIGYMLADPALVAELSRVRLPYHLSAITQVVGEAAIRHAGESLRLVRTICEQRDHITFELQSLGIKTYPSSANFVLFEVDDPDEVWAGLLEREVLVRTYAGVPRLEHCLRVTAGLPEETDAFVSAIKEVLA